VDFLLRLDSAWLTPLGPAQRRILAGRLSTRSYRVGEVLAREGDVGRCLFVLLSGAVTATQGRQHAHLAQYHLRVIRIPTAILT
jgi:CRP-like cAMP-binding protein